jgi:phosphoglycolate phosphatase-like HAD superfamily hydrolase
MTDPAIFREIFHNNRGREPTEKEEKRLFDRYLECLAEEVRNSKDFRVLPGVEEILRDLSARNGFFLGLGTGNLEAGARIKLERPRLNGYFPFGGFGSDSPDRTRLLEIAVDRGTRLAGARSSPDAVFVVGDTPRDVVAGKAIGARTLAVASGPYETVDLEASGPDLLVGDLLDCTKLVEWFQS